MNDLMAEAHRKDYDAKERMGMAMVALNELLLNGYRVNPKMHDLVIDLQRELHRECAHIVAVWD